MVASSGSSSSRSAVDAAADVCVGDGLGNAAAFGLVLDVVGDGRQVELPQRGVDVAIGAGAQADEAQPGAEQVAQASPLLGIGIGHGQVAAAEESGDGVGVVGVGLGLVAVDGFHGEGVTQDEGDVLLSAKVGEPVPGVDALAGDDEVGRKGATAARKASGRAG